MGQMRPAQCYTAGKVLGSCLEAPCSVSSTHKSNTTSFLNLQWPDLLLSHPGASVFSAAAVVGSMRLSLSCLLIVNCLVPHSLEHSAGHTTAIGKGSTRWAPRGLGNRKCLIGASLDTYKPASPNHSVFSSSTLGKKRGDHFPCFFWPGKRSIETSWRPSEPREPHSDTSRGNLRD